MKTTRNSAFTLVELAVVLVIIGLLVGGILAGQNLIRASQLRATIKQMDDLSSSLNAFRDKYQGLPGDLVNAGTFWPSAQPGNGNNIIETATCGSDPDCASFNGERSQFYVQLGLAGFTIAYDGSATLDKGYPSIKLHPNQGMFVSGPWTNIGSENVPPSGYMTGPLYLTMSVCNATTFNVDSSFNDCAIFSGDEIWNIDTKVDDGLPYSGKVMGESFNTPCTTNTAYNLTAKNTAICNLIYSLSR